MWIVWRPCGTARRCHSCGEDSCVAARQAVDQPSRTGVDVDSMWPPLSSASTRTHLCLLNANAVSNPRLGEVETVRSELGLAPPSTVHAATVVAPFQLT
jgi:hypothetical protein